MNTHSREMMNLLFQKELLFMSLRRMMMAGLRVFLKEGKLVSSLETMWKFAFNKKDKRKIYLYTTYKYNLCKVSDDIFFEVHYLKIIAVGAC